MKTVLAILTVLGLTGAVIVNGLPTSGVTRGLSEDLDDFMKLIPKEEITNLFYQYLNYDDEFGEAVEYIMSTEFTNFIKEIENMPEVREILNYLQDAGLDAYGYVNMMNRYLEIPEISPVFKLKSQAEPIHITGGLSGFIKDVKALLPLNKLKRLYEEKLKTSPAFAALIKKLSSKEFQALVDKIMAKPKLQEILNRLKSKKVDVQELLDLLTSVLGLKFGKPSGYYFYSTMGLKDDLEDFMKLVPVDQITDLFYEYLNNDDEFAEAVEYVTSVEFGKFVIEVENMHEVREMLNYLQNAGLDAYGFVNKINRYLEIPEISPFLRSKREVFITGGINGFLKDVKALIPFEKMKKLYEEKLKTSKDFSALVKKLSSPEFQSLVNKIFAMPKTQEVINRLKSKNVDVQEILDIVTSMIGIKFPKPQPPKVYYYRF